MLPETLQQYPIAQALASFDADASAGGKFDRGELTLEIDAAKIVPVCMRLKTEEKFIRCSDVTALDYYPAEPRFVVVYHLHSLARNERLRLKCRVSGQNAAIDSVTGVWRSANWFEREVFDLFGIQFRNHPDLTRIMMPEGWEGHPLRKDYPVTGNRV